MRIGPPLVYAAPALLSATVLVVTSRRWGAGVDPDGTAYLDAANNLAHGHGLVLRGAQPALVPMTHGKTPFPLFWWAPLYPSLLALFERAGVDLVTAARWLNAVLLVALAILLGVLVRSATGSRRAALLAAGFVGISPGIFTIYGWALSEPLFLFLSYLGLGLLAVHLKSGRWSTLLLASSALALALLTRYAGPPLVATGVLAILLLGQGNFVGRLARSAGLVVVSSLPFGLWLLRNDLETGFTTGRQISWHPIGLRRLAHGVVDSTLFVFPEVHGVAHIMAFVVMAAMLVGTAVLARHRAKVESVPPFIAIVLLFVALYVVFLLLTVSLFDASTNLGIRFALPLYPGVVALIAWTLSSGTALTAVRRYGVAALAGATACLSLAALALHARDLYNDGFGFTARAWRHSAGIAWIRRLPANAIVYSNYPEAIYFLTGRYVKSVPIRIDAKTASPNPAYAQEFGTMVQNVRQGALVVFFEKTRRPSLTTESAISAGLGHTYVRHLHDATVFGQAERPAILP